MNEILPYADLIFGSVMILIGSMLIAFGMWNQGVFLVKFICFAIVKQNYEVTGRSNFTAWLFISIGVLCFVWGIRLLF